MYGAWEIRAEFGSLVWGSGSILYTLNLELQEISLLAVQAS